MLRLKTRAQFQAALAGKVLARTSHFALHACALPVAAGGQGVAVRNPLFRSAGVWLGAMVPKRWARRSVTRHLIKRQIYAVAGQHEGSLAQAAHVVRLRSGFAATRFASAASDALQAQVRHELTQLFSQLPAAPDMVEVAP